MERGLARLTGELVSLEMRLPRELCSADIALLGLRNGGDVPGMRLSGTIGFLGLGGATDCVFWRRHDERRRRRVSLFSKWTGIGTDVTNHFMRQTTLVRPSGKVARRPIGRRNHERGAHLRCDSETRDTCGLSRECCADTRRGHALADRWRGSGR